MAGTTGTEAVIQGVTAPMVAVPATAQALLARSAGFGGTMPGMTVKIALRGGAQINIKKDFITKMKISPPFHSHSAD